MSPRVLYLIYQKNKHQITAKGANETLCFLLTKAIERKDINSLVKLGIDKNVAVKVVNKVSIEEGNSEKLNVY